MIGRPELISRAVGTSGPSRSSTEAGSVGASGLLQHRDRLAPAAQCAAVRAAAREPPAQSVPRACRIAVQPPSCSSCSDYDRAHKSVAAGRRGRLIRTSASVPLSSPTGDHRSGAINGGLSKGQVRSIVRRPLLFDTLRFVVTGLALAKHSSGFQHDTAKRAIRPAGVQSNTCPPNNSTTSVLCRSPVSTIWLISARILPATSVFSSGLGLFSKRILK